VPPRSPAARSKSTVVLRAVDHSVSQAVAECLTVCDWERAIPRGATVVIKPNLCTAVQAKAAASNTDPGVTAAVSEILLSRASRIVIGESDGLRQNAWEAFAASGYVEMARRLGVTLVNLSEVPRVLVECEPAGAVEIPRVLLEADALVTLPVLKTHALTYFTGALKNQWGCLPQYDRILLHKHLDPLIVTLHRILHPRLAVMDAIIAMEGRGPANGKPRRLNLVLASQDPVALDATAMRLVGLDPQRARHVLLAVRQGLGCIEAADIDIDGEWDRHVTTFEPAVLDKAIAMMNYMSRYRWFVKYILERDLVFYPVRALVQVLRRVGVVEGG
jgi:uncharacterized protein (DUF362 family)